MSRNVQDEMLQTLKQRVAAKKIENVQIIKASETDPHLPAGAVDLVLAVDVYHELAHPYEVMQRVRDSLRPDGRVAFVEYRKENLDVPIKDVHKMSAAQLEKEMMAVGLVPVHGSETLPLQHILIFGKDSETQLCSFQIAPLFRRTVFASAPKLIVDQQTPSSHNRVWFSRRDYVSARSFRNKRKLSFISGRKY